MLSYNCTAQLLFIITVVKSNSFQNELIADWGDFISNSLQNDISSISNSFQIELIPNRLYSRTSSLEIELTPTGFHLLVTWIEIPAKNHVRSGRRLKVEWKVWLEDLQNSCKFPRAYACLSYSNPEMHVNTNWKLALFWIETQAGFI